MSDNKPLTTQRVRQDLLTSAVRFLNSPGVKGASIKSQIEFLKKKGLTHREITSSLASVTNSSSSSVKPDNKLCLALSYSLLPQGLTNVYGPIRVLLTLTRVTISLAVLLYISYRLIELVMTFSPRLRSILNNLFIKLRTALGFNTRNGPVVPMEMEMDQPTQGLSLDSLQELEGCEPVDVTVLAEDGEPQEFEVFRTELSDLKTKQDSNMNELKSEMKSIRSLLLSTSQFPKPQIESENSQITIQTDFNPTGFFHQRSMEPNATTGTDTVLNSSENSQAMNFLHSLSDPDQVKIPKTELDV